MGRRSDARQRLLNSAGTLMREHGYEAVGVAEICRQAEVQKGSFYHFFPSKQSLALELVEGYAEEGAQRLAEALDAPGTPAQRLWRYLVSIHGYHAERCELSRNGFAGCPLGNFALEMSARDPVLREALHAAFERQIRGLQRLLEAMAEAGELLPRQPLVQLAESLLALIEGQVMLAKLRAEVGGLQHLPGAAFDLLGLSPPENFSN